jgi:hypothetical protein
MKHTLTLIAVIALAGCKTIEVPPINIPSPTIPPIVIGGQPDKPDTGIPANVTFCDPNPAKYNAQYFSNHAVARSEEVGIEAQRKIVARAVFLCPDRNSYYMISSLVMNRIKADRTCDPFTEDGYSYKVKGWVSSEPKANEANTMPVSQTPDKYIIFNCWRVK